MIILTALLIGLAGYLTVYAVYQLALFIANWLIAEPAEFVPSAFRRFTVLVPAHNEELFVARLLTSLSAQDYPRDRYGVTVIATTYGRDAGRRETAGATSRAQSDPDDRGKGRPSAGH